MIHICMYLFINGWRYVYVVHGAINEKKIEKPQDQYGILPLIEEIC